MASLVTKGTTLFAVNDILRIKDGMNDEWMKVTAVTDISHYTVERDKANIYGAGANPTWKKGASVVNYGQSGDGGVYMTACETNAPYLSIFDHAGSPWDTVMTRVRMGNLNGFLDYEDDRYGIAIGETNAHLKYDPTNGMRIKGTFAIESMYSLPSDVNLVGYWSLDDVNGAKAIDNSGHNNVGTLNGNPQWSSGISGKCLDFDGTGDHVSVPDDSILNFGTGSFSVSYWLNFNGVDSQQRWSLGKGIPYLAANPGWAIANWSTGDPITPYILVSDGISYVQATFGAMDRGIWYNLTFIVNKGDDTLKTYLNGEYKNSASISGYGSTTSTDALLIGAGNGLNLSDCKIDEVRLYDRVLTVNEIKALYLYPSGNKSSSISGGQTPWAHGSDVTKIDGGAIFANSITLTSAANDFALSSISGNLDNISDGSSYGKIGVTYITGGKIIISGGASQGVSGTLPVGNSEAKCTDPNADQTSVNTAADIAGQGALATKNAVGAINILHNGGFRNDFIHWTTSSISGANTFDVWHDNVDWTLRDGDSPTGFGSTAYIATTTASPGPQEAKITSGLYRVTPGKDYILRFLGGNHRFGNTSCYAQIHLYDNADAWVRTLNSDYVTTTYAGGSTLTNWQVVTKKFTTASNEEKVLIRFLAKDGYTSEPNAIFFIDQVILCEGDAIPEWTALSTNILNWEHGSDTTMIDGGNIYTNTITASAIYGAGFGTLTITSGKIAINTTDALEIQAAGNVKVLAGADIKLIGSDTDPGNIFFEGTSYDVKCGCNAAGTEFYISPKTDDEVTMCFGEDAPWSVGNLPAYMKISSRNNMDIYTRHATYPAPESDSAITFEVTDTYGLVKLIAEFEGASATIGFTKSAAVQAIYPYEDLATDLGLEDTAWDDAWADDYNNAADFYHLDTRDDLAAIKAIKGSGIIDDVTGLELIDDSTISEWMLSRYKRDGERLDDKENIVKSWKKGDVIFRPDGKPYLSLKLIDSLLMGAIRQLDAKIEKINKP